MKEQFQKFMIRKHKNLLLLFALLILFATSAFSYNSKYHDLFVDVGLSLVAITAIYSFYNKNYHLYLGIFLASGVIITNWLDNIAQGYIITTKISFTLLFFTYILVLTLKNFLLPRKLA